MNVMGIHNVIFIILWLYKTKSKYRLYAEIF